MMAGGMCSMCCTMSGMMVCNCNMTMGMQCKMEMTANGCCLTCTSGDKMCCDMIQACCDCIMGVHEGRLRRCLMMGGTPITRMLRERALGRTRIESGGAHPSGALPCS